jgi:hypothetical protein
MVQSRFSSFRPWHMDTWRQDNDPTSGTKMPPRSERTKKIIMSAVVAGGAVLGIVLAAPANAAPQQWQLNSQSYVWLTSPSLPGGECVGLLSTHTDDVEASISTLVFPDRTCTTGAGVQCRTTVPESPVGRPVFDADSCSWSLQSR